MPQISEHSWVWMLFTSLSLFAITALKLSYFELSYMCDFQQHLTKSSFSTFL